MASALLVWPSTALLTCLSRNSQSLRKMSPPPVAAPASWNSIFMLSGNTAAASVPIVATALFSTAISALLAIGP